MMRLIFPILAAMWSLALCQTPQPTTPEAALSEFNKAVSDGRLIGSGSAFELLRQMRSLGRSDQWTDQLDQLVDELTRRASEVVTRYTKGDEVPQKKADYDRCAALYEAANELEPSSRAQARMWFCRGRSFLEPGEQRDFGKAVEYLEKAVQLAPDDGGYHYNALGVAYLQEGLTTEAAAEFQKAIDHDSPVWTYPRHDLALTYLETGDYAAAQEKYREAIARAGDQQTGYLHYNLGLLDHQLGRRKEARIEYETALKLFKEQMALEGSRNDAERAAVFRNDAAEAYNALGALSVAEGKRKQAAEDYEQSLQLNPDLAAARNNLDLLEGRIKKTAKR
jgi:tetratricopeptide (TPR) repeat protein